MITLLSLVAYASLYVGGRDDGKKLGEAETETETETEKEAVAAAVAEQRQRETRETRETGERNRTWIEPVLLRHSREM